MTKVLVFESDAAFAGELRNELGKLGCATQVVDDGNLGLQQAASERPDLILLSIELPRMNGFSVCNKLKKDPSLKDVPLIIMSSESSDETFDQHRKLRTRAEDYVHKPIAFGELLQHIQAFVALGPPGGSVPPEIVIDDDMVVNSQDYVSDDEGTQVAAIDLGAPKGQKVDADVDAFAESAFGKMTGRSQPPPAGAQNGAEAPAAHGPPPVPKRGAADTAELERARSEVERARAELREVRAELERASARASELERVSAHAAEREKALDATRKEQDKSAHDLSEDNERMGREIEELRQKLANAPKTGGGISSREFLDLREALNKKDKEILGYKETSTKKDKELIEASDRALTLERSKADLEDKILATDRELADARDKIDSLAADKDAAKKAAADYKARVEKVKADVEAKAGEIAELKAKREEERTSAEAALLAAKSEHEQLMMRANDEHQTEIDELAATHHNALQQAQSAKDDALREAAERAEQAQAAALGAREAQLKSEHESKMGSLHRAHQQELGNQLEQARTRHTAEVAAIEERNAQATEAARLEAEKKLSDREAELEQERERRLGVQAREHAERVAEVENDRDARVASAEAKAAREVEETREAAVAQKKEADERIAKLEMDLAGVRGDLASVEEAKRNADTSNAARISELETKLAREIEMAKDRIVALEAEIASTRQDLMETRAKLEAETRRADKAFAKWESDRASLDHAKDALAVALAQIEEAEGRSIG